MKMMMLFLLLLKSTKIGWLHGNLIPGMDHNLHCVNDYLFTVNCSLSIAPSESISDHNESYWLTFTDLDEPKKKYVCLLVKTEKDYFCSFKTSDTMPEDSDIFSDTDIYEISLCHNQYNGSEICELLEYEYEPVINIKPNAPCCLSVNHNSSQFHFIWKNTYEEYSPYTALTANLMYELHCYERKGEVTLPPFHTESASLSVDDEKFVPNTEYAARVRTSPNQNHFYGEWSDWSSEVHWMTEPATNDESTPKSFPTKKLVSELSKKVFIPLSVAVLLVLLLCYAPIKKWRQSAFIPTPAPYFDTLYSDCKGDFKSWVVTQENTADMLKEEETLQIDTLTQCADVQEEDCPLQYHEQLVVGSAYNNVTVPVCDVALLGVPYAVSTMAPQSDLENSVTSLTLSCQSSSAAGDSGCWLCSNTSLEKGPPWYCNEYCTLSSFQQHGSITAEHHGSL